MHADQLAEHVDAGPGWNYVVLRGVWTDQRLTNFDSRYELTDYPSDLLWGPGTRSDAVTWLAETAPNGHEVTYSDRVFALRRDRGKVYLPCRPETFLGLSGADRAGIWHLVRADFPTDALSHVQHVDLGDPCPRDDFGFGGCQVDDIASDSWSDIAAVVNREFLAVQPVASQDVRVPRRWPFPSTVGYD